MTRDECLAHYEGRDVVIGLQSWASLTWHPALLLKCGPKRAKIQWQDTAFRHRAGTISYVPYHALKPSEGPNDKG